MREDQAWHILCCCYVYVFPAEIHEGAVTLFCLFFLNVHPLHLPAFSFQIHWNSLHWCSKSRQRRGTPLRDLTVEGGCGAQEDVQHIGLYRICCCGCLWWWSNWSSRMESLQPSFFVQAQVHEGWSRRHHSPEAWIFCHPRRLGESSRANKCLPKSPVSSYGSYPPSCVGQKEGECDE